MRTYTFSMINGAMRAEQLSPEEVFDGVLRLRRNNQMRQQLGLEPNATELIGARLPSVGIEIEMAWHQALPELAAKWPNPSDRVKDSTSAGHAEFLEDYARADRTMKEMLAITMPYIPSSPDAYWEFAFMPSEDSDVIAAEVKTLYDAEILRLGTEYATHLTITGLKKYEDAHIILWELEHNGGSSAARIEQAIHDPVGSWSVKSRGGVRRRWPRGMVGKPEGKAYELRSLITTSPEQIAYVMRTAQLLVQEAVQEPGVWEERRQAVKAECLKLGLEWGPWQKPKNAPEFWGRYALAIAESTQNNVGTRERT